MNFLIGLAIVAYIVFCLYLKIHGVILAFKKKWYFGVLALLVPFFAEILCISKIFFKKDLLA